MATIDDTGIKSTSLSEYQTDLEQAFQNVFGQDIDLDSQTPQGQLIGIFALDLSQLDDSTVQLFNALNIFNAAGSQLDAYGNQFNIFRNPATPSTVTAQLTGSPTTLIPSGSRARTTNGDIFFSTENVTLDVSGLGSGVFQSQDVGAIAIDANTLTQIVDTDIVGWDTVDNAGAGTVGQLQQTDTEFRSFYYQTLSRNAVSTLDAIRSRVAALENVLEVKVFENDTAQNVILQNVELLPHSIAVVVKGGVAQDIGQAIFDTKTVGADTQGADLALQTAVVVPTNDGASTITIYYYPVDPVTVQIDLTIQLYQNSPDVINTIKSRIIEYFEGTFTGGINEDGSVQFDTSGIDIAEPSYLSRLYTPINSVTGFEVLNLEQQIQGSGTPMSVITPNLNQQLVVDVDSIDVTIV